MFKRIRSVLFIIGILLLTLIGREFFSHEAIPTVEAQATVLSGVAYTNDPTTGHYGIYTDNPVVFYTPSDSTSRIRFCNGSCTFFADLVQYLSTAVSDSMFGGYKFVFEGANNGDIIIAEEELTGSTASCTMVISGGYRYCNVAVPAPDADSDGIPDSLDNCINTPNPLQENADGDSEGDACDLNDDNDSYPDSTDDCDLQAGTSTIDRLGCPDGDGDGYSDTGDSCPAQSGTSTLDQVGCPDGDGDGYSDSGDGCPAEAGTSTADQFGCPDGDGDGYSDIGDNCPAISNPAQADNDGDGDGNSCDADDDNDGIDDGPDDCEFEAGTSTEDRLGCPDGDGDGYSDTGDNCPVDANPDQANNDGDGEGDVCDIDDDADGVNDDVDNCQFIANPDQDDEDEDGRGDPCDPNISGQGTCGADGVAGFTVFNDGTEDQPFEWLIRNPIDNGVLAGGSGIVLADEVYYVTYGLTTGDIVFEVTSADEPVSVPLSACFTPTDTPTPTATVQATATTPEPEPQPIVGCVEVDLGDDGNDFPTVLYDSAQCEENEDLPEERARYQPIQIAIGGAGGGGPSEGDGSNSISDFPATCPDWVLYQSNVDGQWDIWRTNSEILASTSQRNLSSGDNPDEYNLSPSQSPDGRYIAYTTNRDGIDNFEIYISEVDNLGNANLHERATFNTKAPDMDPVWSPGNLDGYDQGRYIVYESARNSNFWALYIFDVTTGEEQPLTNNAAYNSLNAYWHPNGDRLIFQSDRSGFWQIYELDLTQLGDDGFPVQTQLTDGIGDYLDPVYNSDGTEIAVRSNRDGINNVIYVMDADGGNLSPISNQDREAFNPVWSPESDLLAYEAEDTNDREIYVYDFESGRTRILTNNDANDYAPTWVCGTNRIVFVSEALGSPNIFATDALPIDAFGIAVDPQRDGDSLVQLTNNPASNTFPQGAPTEENGSRSGALPGGANFGN